MAKVKVKHEKESSELKLQNEKSRSYIERLSQEIYTLNEKQLEFQKENEFMKTRIRHLENNVPAYSGRPSLPINAKLMGKLPGKILLNYLVNHCEMGKGMVIKILNNF